MSRIAWVSILFAVGFLVLVLASTLGSRPYSCEVCVTYRGVEKCRTASGDEQDATISMAKDNACAFLASGRTEVIQCTSGPPSRVACERR